jgi:hypothetical protein
VGVAIAVGVELVDLQLGARAALLPKLEPLHPDTALPVALIARSLLPLTLASTLAAWSPSLAVNPVGCITGAIAGFVFVACLGCGGWAGGVGRAAPQEVAQWAALSVAGAVSASWGARIPGDTFFWAAYLASHAVQPLLGLCGDRAFVQLAPAVCGAVAVYVGLALRTARRVNVVQVRQPATVLGAEAHSPPPLPSNSLR